MISYLCLILYFLFSINPYSLSSTSCELIWTCENSKFKFRDNFGIKKCAPGSKCRIGGSMCRPILQCAGRYFNVCLKCRPVLQIQIEVPNTNLKCRPVLQTLIKVPAGTLSFKKCLHLLFWYLSVC